VSSTGTGGRSSRGGPARKAIFCGAAAPQRRKMLTKTWLGHGLPPHSTPGLSTTRAAVAVTDYTHPTDGGTYLKVGVALVGQRLSGGNSDAKSKPQC